MEVVEEYGERGRNRTFNLLIKSQLLCQLSYAPARNEVSGEIETVGDAGFFQGTAPFNVTRTRRNAPMARCLGSGSV